jgi:hypothetical protein
LRSARASEYPIWDLGILNSFDPLVNLSISNSEPEKFTRVVNEEFPEVEANQALKAKRFDKSMLFALKQDVGFHFISNSNPAE